MRIRHVLLQDAERFAYLCKKVDESGYMLYEPGERVINIEKEREKLKGFINDVRSTILIAEDNNQLIGYMMVSGGNTRRIYHSAYLVLGVLEEFRGQGVATKLFNQLFSWAKEKGFSRLELTVIKDNEKAFNLYRKMGFVLEGEKVHSLMIDGNPVNEYYLYKLI